MPGAPPMDPEEERKVALTSAATIREEILGRQDLCLHRGEAATEKHVEAEVRAGGCAWHGVGVWIWAAGGRVGGKEGGRGVERLVILCHISERYT